MSSNIRKRKQPDDETISDSDQPPKKRKLSQVCDTCPGSSNDNKLSKEYDPYYVDNEDKFNKMITRIKGKIKKNKKIEEIIQNLTTIRDTIDAYEIAMVELMSDHEINERYTTILSPHLLWIKRQYRSNHYLDSEIFEFYKSCLRVGEYICDELLEINFVTFCCEIIRNQNADRSLRLKCMEICTDWESMVERNSYEDRRNLFLNGHFGVEKNKLCRIYCNLCNQSTDDMILQQIAKTIQETAGCFNTYFLNELWSKRGYSGKKEVMRCLSKLLLIGVNFRNDAILKNTLIAYEKIYGGWGDGISMSIDDIIDAENGINEELKFDDPDTLKDAIHGAVVGIPVVVAEIIVEYISYCRYSLLEMMCNIICFHDDDEIKQSALSVIFFVVCVGVNQCGLGGEPGEKLDKTMKQFGSLKLLGDAIDFYVGCHEVISMKIIYIMVASLHYDNNLYSAHFVKECVDKTDIELESDYSFYENAVKGFVSEYKEKDIVDLMKSIPEIIDNNS